MRSLAMLILLLLPALPAAGDPLPHPLDPLSAAEIETAVAVLKDAGKLPDAHWLPWLLRHEPPKAEVLAHKAGDPVRRRAFAVVHHRAANRVFEAVVDLGDKKVASWVEIQGVQAPAYEQDYVALDRAVKADATWVAAVRKRGLDPKEVFVWPWTPGPDALPSPPGTRVVFAEAIHEAVPTQAFARPLEGLTAVVDLAAEKVLEVRDLGVVPMPADPSFVRGKTGHPPRPALKPLEITAPQGPDFEVKGHEVAWQNWRFRFAPDPREGLVLYAVRYRDGDKERSILYRGSVSELFVNYGDPSPGHRHRMYLDAGEGGLTLWSLEPGTDAPAHARFFDSDTADDRGRVKKVERTIALFERDGGLAWKHAFHGGTNESRRGRELVLLAITTLSTYDYGIQWVFHQDGTLEAEVLLTGLVQVKAVAVPHPLGHAGHRFAHAVDAERRLLATNHQHFFSYRLDLDVDGLANRVVERNVEVAPDSPDNPAGNAFVMRETPLTKESEARRMVNLETSRHWAVVNPTRRNAAKEPTAYLLVPGSNAVLAAGPRSLARKRAGFTAAHLWVTPFEATERYAAGDYVYGSVGGDGLPTWTAKDRDLTEADVVVWYTLGVTHLPRREEWPVMPVSRAGFKLVPGGFFDRNPAMDLPRP